MPLLQVRQAARGLGVHENTLRRWEERGFIRAVHLPSGVRRFRAEDVEALKAQMFTGFPPIVEASGQSPRMARRGSRPSNGSRTTAARRA
jgi:excisionase family DNA binding protein